jgi:hypothetical protein
LPEELSDKHSALFDRITRGILFTQVPKNKKAPLPLAAGLCYY